MRKTRRDKARSIAIRLDTSLRSANAKFVELLVLFFGGQEVNSNLCFARMRSRRQLIEIRVCVCVSFIKVSMKKYRYSSQDEEERKKSIN